MKTEYIQDISQGKKGEHFISNIISKYCFISDDHKIYISFQNSWKLFQSQDSVDKSIEVAVSIDIEDASTEDDKTCLSLIPQVKLTVAPNESLPYLAPLSAILTSPSPPWLLCTFCPLW